MTIDFNANWNNLQKTKKVLIKTRKDAYCYHCKQNKHYDKNYWKQNNVFVLKFIKKKRQIDQQKTKNEIRKIKINSFARKIINVSISINSNFIENFDEVFFVSS